jgi:hypothetical protein
MTERWPGDSNTEHNGGGEERRTIVRLQRRTAASVIIAEKGFRVDTIAADIYIYIYIYIYMTQSILVFSCTNKAGQWRHYI